MKTSINDKIHRLGKKVSKALINQCCLFALLPLQLLAQVQWASKIITFSSEYSSGNGQQYRASQVIGKPNKLPQAESGATAWRPNQEDSGEEWIKVGFDVPITVSQIAIVQNYGAGCVIKIVLSDEQNPAQENTITVAQSPKNPLFVYKLPKPTTFKVASLKLFLNTKKVSGWNEIDAIGISSNAMPTNILPNLVADVPKDLKQENLGNNVNSDAGEVAPIISPDGKTLYFTRFNHPQNIRSKDDYDVWYSEQKEGQWQQAKNIGRPVNNESVNSITHISPDDRTAMLMNAYRPDGTFGLGASTTRKNAAGWTSPQQMNIENYTNSHPKAFAGFYIGPYNDVMILSLQDQNSVGGADLYVSFLQANGAWSAPKNIGKINTADDELTPFLATDNRTLYFTTDGRSGYGGTDIFLSKRLDDTWLNWSEPENLGPSFNDDNFDAHFTIPAAGDYAYFCTTKDEKFGFDIYRIKLPEKLKPAPTAILKGTVIDQATQKPIEAEVLIEDLDKKQPPQKLEYDPAVGDFKLVLENQKQYGLTAKKQGYQSASSVIDLSNEKTYQEIRKDIFLAPIEVGQKITLNALLFKQSLPELLPSSLPELERLKNVMIENPTLEILLEGHTDNVGDFDANLQLSKQRVDEVKKYLTTNGISASRIQTKGLGGTQPISSNYQELTRKLNRRVELTILKK